MLTFGSLFAGIGGFDLGFERAGMACRWQVENEKHCIRTLQRHWPHVARFRDVREWSCNRDEHAVDVLCGGWPCQDLSVAGKRAGLAGERSGLFYEFVRVVSELHPAWVVGENVPGLLSSAGGADMQSVVTGLANLGYCVCWRVLDARFFGVPQQRRRVFFVCHSDPHRAAAVLFESEGRDGNPAKMRAARPDLARCLGASTGGVSGKEQQATLVHALRSEGFDASEDGTGRGTPLVAACLQSRIRKGCFTDPVNDNINAMPLQSPNAACGIEGPGWRADGEPMFTLDRQCPHGVATDVDAASPDANGVRAVPGLPGPLDVFACEACAEGPDGPRYRQIGNAVVPAIAEWIGRRIIGVSFQERV